MFQSLCTSPTCVQDSCLSCPSQCIVVTNTLMRAAKDGTCMCYKALYHHLMYIRRDGIVVEYVGHGMYVHTYLAS